MKRHFDQTKYCAKVKVRLRESITNDVQFTFSFFRKLFLLLKIALLSTIYTISTHNTAMLGRSLWPNQVMRNNEAHTA